jgi:hypothetical protein
VDHANTSNAQEYFSRQCHGEIGRHHCDTGYHLLRYAQEAPCRENKRRVANGDQTRTVAACDETLAFGGFQRVLAKACKSRVAPSENCGE